MKRKRCIHESVAMITELPSSKYCKLTNKVKKSSNILFVLLLTALSFSKTGWMMWNWLVSVLAVGASIVLYDGSPLVPHPGVLWDVVDSVGSVAVIH